MLDVEHIHRSDIKVVGKLSWWLHRATEGDDGPPLTFVIIECPYGHLGTLRHMMSGTGHQIGDDGVVTPSVVCPIKSCTFHDHVRLLGWPAG